MTILYPFGERLSVKEVEEESSLKEVLRKVSCFLLSSAFMSFIFLISRVTSGEDALGRGEGECLLLDLVEDLLGDGDL